MYDNNGTRLWGTNTQDASSRDTGSSVFDFDGDGAAEVVYADEQNLHIYDGKTGAERATISDHGSGTIVEYPIVVDIDHDGESEIVLASNNYAFAGWTGITVLGSESRSWTPARPVWNQYAYSISNVNDDGSIPQNQAPNWTRWNNFRAGAPIEGLANWLSDVYVAGTSYCEAGCSADTDGTAQIAVTVVVSNRGKLDASDVDVSLMLGGVEGTEIGHGVIDSVPSGGQAYVTITVPHTSWTAGDATVVVTPGANTPECDTSNNTAVIEHPIVLDFDDDGIDDVCDACVAMGQPEVCDGVDNDCDGATDAADADFIRPPCELQEGVCEGTTKPDDLCMGEGGWAPCDDAVYASATEGAYDPELDACDGVDNDCDGTTDAADASLDVVLCENQAGCAPGRRRRRRSA
ncbi:MAG: VCBS repeat-containing protein [Deltaproteobacteria bacterium]|nr:VCBS repeat-containing protein [Deltaproteobacteria bacterium]